VTLINFVEPSFEFHQRHEFAANIMDTGRIGALTAEVVSQAILRGVKRAKSLPGYPDYPAWEDLSV
jgi:hypothetical protein